jgi:hypothetical protein
MLSEIDVALLFDMAGMPLVVGKIVGFNFVS